MSAIAIDPGQSFIGNDGLWSPVPIKVGSKAAPLLLLPSTSQSSIWTLRLDACTNSNAAPNCTLLRGGTWDTAESVSYKQITRPGSTSSNFLLPWTAETALSSPNLTNTIDLNASATAGQDTIAFGYQANNGPPLTQQTIYSYSGNAPYVGLLGLLPYASEFQDVAGTFNSSLGDLSATRAIKSAFYAYNAGAYYRTAWSSLVLGGYDAKRGDPRSGLEVPMGQQTDRDLLIYVNDISLSTNGAITHVTNTASQPWMIDSTIPEIWLPLSACQVFEDAFGLVYNFTSQMYFIDTALHDTLLQRNASVTFTLSGDAAGTNKTSIFFPFAAFNQTAAWPIIGGPNSSYTSATRQYFPLKRAADNSQFFLGRTFLQEAYLAADYDNRIFYLSPATFSPDHATDIRTWPDSSSTLSRGAIAGIALGAVAALALLAGLLFLYWKKRSHKRARERERERASWRASSMGGTTINDEVMSMQHRHEYFKPPPGMSEAPNNNNNNDDEASDQFKAELDARFTARGFLNERHELDAGSVSRSSLGGGGAVSPFRPRHSRLPSDPSSLGVPSPLMSDRPSPPLPSAGEGTPFGAAGSPSPFGGTPPAVEEGRQWFGGGPFEMGLGTVRHRAGRRTAPDVVAPESGIFENGNEAETAAAQTGQTPAPAPVISEAVGVSSEHSESHGEAVSASGHEQHHDEMLPSQREQEAQTDAH
ncbi:Hypothetical predicted protein [Lecanosticta acicola]|uniref:Peptidase A1 domain-containing protein n=1 Tax=Lecanosticta acicola TaxID=111012 RepID=A0AAI8YYG0_9PEZI|nr:Hypothetical predicted protein [Lecanosticta acicola]